MTIGPVPAIDKQVPESPRRSGESDPAPSRHHGRQPAIRQVVKALIRRRRGQGHTANGVSARLRDPQTCQVALAAMASAPPVHQRPRRDGAAWKRSFDNQTALPAPPPASAEAW